MTQRNILYLLFFLVYLKNISTRAAPLQVTSPPENSTSVSETSNDVNITQDIPHDNYSVFQEISSVDRRVDVIDIEKVRAIEHLDVSHLVESNATSKNIIPKDPGSKEKKVYHHSATHNKILKNYKKSAKKHLSENAKVRSAKPTDSPPIFTLPPPPSLTQPPATPPPSQTQPPATPPPIQTQPPATPPPSQTQPPATPPPSQTQPPATPPPSQTQPPATPPPSQTQPPATSPPSQTQPPATQPITTQAITTQPITTQALTTQPITTQVITTQPITTEALTTQSITTQALTTQSISTEVQTTQPVTTEVITTQPITTEVPTTQPITTEVPTTQPITTEVPTTQPITTSGPTLPSITTLVPTVPLSTTPLQATSPQPTSSSISGGSTIGPTAVVPTEKTTKPSQFPISTPSAVTSRKPAPFSTPKIIITTASINNTPVKTTKSILQTGIPANTASTIGSYTPTVPGLPSITTNYPGEFTTEVEPPAAQPIAPSQPGGMTKIIPPYVPKPTQPSIAFPIRLPPVIPSGANPQGGNGKPIIKECPEEVESMGCFYKPKSLFTSLIVIQKSGQSLEELFCECGNLVEEKGWAAFILTDGKCFSSARKTGYNRGGVSSNCINDDGNLCTDSDTYCQGQEGSMMVYSIMSSKRHNL